MTWEELKKRQVQELRECTAEGMKKRLELFKEQEIFLKNCIVTPEGETILRKMLDLQCDQWKRDQETEWHQLLNAHQYERDHFNKQPVRGRER